MINILTTTTTIVDGNGDPLNGVLKVRASQSFTYDNGTETTKVGTDYIVVSIVNGKLYSALSLAPTSGAQQNKSGLFYWAEIHKNNKVISTDYWLLDKSLEPSVEYADIPLANPANKQPYVPSPFGVEDGGTTPDLTPYATKQWVLDQEYVSDLSAYATISYVDGKHADNLVLIQQNENDIAENLALISENEFAIEENATNIEINRLEIAGHHLLSNLNGSTGLMFGGVLSVSAELPANTKFDVSAGYGLIVDSTTDPTNPIEYQVSWGAFEDVTLNNLTTALSTYIGIDKFGGIVQQSSDFSSSQRKEIIRLGRIAHFEKTEITAILSLGILRYNKSMNGEDLALSLGTITKSGNIYSPASTDLTIQKSTGKSYRLGINSQLDNTSPNQTIDPAISSVEFSYLHSDGAGGAIIVDEQTDMDGSQYDDGNGNLVSVGNNNYTIQRIYYFPVSNVTAITYGLTVYGSLTAAKSNFSNDPVPAYEVLEGATLRAAVIIKGNASDLSSVDTVFVAAGKLGEFSGSAGGADGATDLQSAYDASTVPQIVTNAGALVLQNGVTDDETSVLEIKNYNGDVKLELSGDGEIRAAGGVFSGDVDMSKNLLSFMSTLKAGEPTSNGYIKFASTIEDIIQDYSAYVGTNLDDFGGKWGVSINDPDENMLFSNLLSYSYTFKEGNFGNPMLPKINIEGRDQIYVSVFNDDITPGIYTTRKGSLGLSKTQSLLYFEDSNTTNLQQTGYLTIDQDFTTLEHREFDFDTSTDNRAQLLIGKDLISLNSNVANSDYSSLIITDSYIELESTNPDAVVGTPLSQLRLESDGSYQLYSSYETDAGVENGIFSFSPTTEEFSFSKSVSITGGLECDGIVCGSVSTDAGVFTRQSGADPSLVIDALGTASSTLIYSLDSVTKWATFVSNTSENFAITDVVNNNQWVFNTQGIFVPNILTADPTTVEACGIYYNSSTSKMRVKEGGIWKNMI